MEKNMTIHGLRGLCALLVVVGHVYEMSVKGGFFTPFNLSIHSGYIGVNIFFMISGFVIPISIFKYRTAKEFFINRFLRIYPLFTFLHLIMFAAGPIIGYEWFKNIHASNYVINFISNFLLLPGMFDFPLAQKNAWSLSYEFVFYIAMSAFYLKIKNKARFIAGVSIFCVASYYHPRMLFFLIGLTAFCMKSKNISTPNILNNVAPIIFIAMFYTAKNFTILLILGFLFFLPLIAEKGLFSKMLQSSFFKFYGNISYSFYLIHPFALYPFKVIFGKYSSLILSNNLEYVVIIFFAIMGIGLATIMSNVSYIYIEGLFTRYLLKKPLYTRNQHIYKKEFSLQK